MPIPVLQAPQNPRNTLAQARANGGLASAQLVPEPWRRLLAFLIDFSMLHACSLWIARWLSAGMLRALLPNSGGAAVSDASMVGYFGQSMLLTWPICLFCFSFAYYVLFLHSWGTTVGMGLLRLKMIGEDGTMPGVGKILQRYFASLVNFLTWGVSFYLLAYRPGGRCLHDLLSQTRVVCRDKMDNLPKGEAATTSIREIPALPANSAPEDAHSDRNLKSDWVA